MSANPPLSLEPTNQDNEHPYNQPTYTKTKIEEVVMPWKRVRKSTKALPRHPGLVNHDVPGGFNSSDPIGIGEPAGWGDWDQAASSFTSASAISDAVLAHSNVMQIFGSRYADGAITVTATAIFNTMVSNHSDKLALLSALHYVSRGYNANAVRRDLSASGYGKLVRNVPDSAIDAVNQYTKLYQELFSTGVDVLMSSSSGGDQSADVKANISSVAAKVASISPTEAGVKQIKKFGHYGFISNNVRGFHMYLVVKYAFDVVSGAKVAKLESELQVVNPILKSLYGPKRLLSATVNIDQNFQSGLDRFIDASADSFDKNMRITNNLDSSVNASEAVVTPVVFGNYTLDMLKGKRASDVNAMASTYYDKVVGAGGSIKIRNAAISVFSMIMSNAASSSAINAKISTNLSKLNANNADEVARQIVTWVVTSDNPAKPDIDKFANKFYDDYIIEQSAQRMSTRGGVEYIPSVYATSIVSVKNQLVAALHGMFTNYINAMIKTGGTAHNNVVGHVTSQAKSGYVSRSVSMGNDVFQAVRGELDSYVDRSWRERNIDPKSLYAEPEKEDIRVEPTDTGLRRTQSISPFYAPCNNCGHNNIMWLSSHATRDFKCVSCMAAMPPILSTAPNLFTYVIDGPNTYQSSDGSDTVNMSGDNKILNNSVFSRKRKPKFRAPGADTDMKGSSGGGEGYPSNNDTAIPSNVLPGLPGVLR